MRLDKPHYVVTIEKYSDYHAHDPYWINLYRTIDSKYVMQKLSDALNKYFIKHGPDASEDYTSFTGPLMKLETARKALSFALCSCKIKTIEVDTLIDGVGSLECDGRENDPVTGDLLHAIPVNKDSVLDEMTYLIDQDKLSKDDWMWLQFVVNSFSNDDMQVNAMLRRITRKHR